MDPSKIFAPPGLCGYHRHTYRQLTRRSRTRLAWFAVTMCRCGRSRFCTWKMESTR